MYYSFHIKKTGDIRSGFTFSYTLTTASYLEAVFDSKKLFYKVGSNTILVANYTEEELQIYYNFTGSTRCDIRHICPTEVQLISSIRVSIRNNITTKDLISLLNIVFEWTSK